MDHTYWLKQDRSKPLFPDIEWSRPVQKAHAGRLAIIGGNKLGFVAVHSAYETAQALSAGDIKVVLPSALRSTIPSSVTNAIFTDSNPSGGFSKTAIDEFRAIGDWADVCLLIGDTGKNSETAIILESLLESTAHLVITRDAIDLLRPAGQKMVERDNTTLVLSFAQLQKLLQSVYYPVVLSFSMQLLQLVESLHKFTITYPSTIVVFHQNQIVTARGGQVTTTPWDEPLEIWRGTTAVRIACYLLWNKNKQLEAITASLV